MKNDAYYHLILKLGKSTTNIDIQKIELSNESKMMKKLNKVVVNRDKFFVDGSIEVSMVCDINHIQTGRNEVTEAMKREIKAISKAKNNLVKSLEKNDGMISLFKHSPVGIENPLSINWLPIQKLSDTGQLYHYFNKDENEHRYVVTENGVVEMEFTEWQMKKLSDYIHQNYKNVSIKIN